MNKNKFFDKLDPKKVFTSIFSSLLAALFSCIYLILRNYSKLGTDDIFLSLRAVVLHWLVIYIISYFIMRNVHKSSLASTVVVVPISVFYIVLEYISRFIPNIHYWHGVYLLLTLFIVLWMFIKKHLQSEEAYKLNLVIGMLFLVLILINGVNPIINIVKDAQLINFPTDTFDSGSDPSLTASETNPNIYFFIFDEYSGPEALKRYTGYDNRKFNHALTDLGFNISYSSRNYTFSTTVEIPNLLNLSVTGVEYSEKMKDEILQSPFLFTTVRQAGYNINLIDDQNFISTPNDFFTYRFVPQGVLSREESLMTLLIDKSLYQPFRKTSSQSRIVEVTEMFNYAVQSSTFQEKNLFTIGYIMFPHLPWVVDENGNENAASDRHDWTNSDVYLGQLKYANKLILQMVEKIIKNDPDSTIILMSDHAYRQPFHLNSLYGIEYPDMPQEWRYMRNILNAVYIGGKEIDIEGMSGINTLRTVLDRMLSTNLGLIEESK